MTSHRKQQTDTIFLLLPVYTGTTRPREQVTDFSSAKELGQSQPHIICLTAHRTEEQKGPRVAPLVPCSWQQLCCIYSVDQQALMPLRLPLRAVVNSSSQKHGRAEAGTKH